MNDTPENAPEEDFLEEVCDLDSLGMAEREHEAKVLAKALQKGDPTLQFPSLTEKLTPRIMTEGQKKSGMLFPETSARFSSGLLDDLRAQAGSVLSEQERGKQEGQRLKAQFDASLRRIYAFLNELTQHLNLLKPAIPRDYPVVDGQSLHSLVWREGNVDHRSSRLHTATARMELVTLSYFLATNTEEAPLRLTRETLLAETLRNRLFDYGIKTQIHEQRNARLQLEAMTFVIPHELQVVVRWSGDMASGKLRCETRNLESLGRHTWLFPPEAPMYQVFLDEFGLMLLGKPNDFPFVKGRKLRQAE